MPVDHTRFKRRRPHDPEDTAVEVLSLGPGAAVRVTGDIEAKDPDGNKASLSVSRLSADGQLVSDLQSQELLQAVLLELKHIRLHLEALTGEDLRGDVGYADQ
tara:strand:- start:859 stop:1167 length:309 start_codon:yes stop_codon:yes gene_type:complete